MKKDTLVFVGHITESIEDIELFTKNIAKEDFLKNKEKQNAVIRSIEIIGEAIKNISENIKKKYPKIEWKKITGTRDKVAHYYFGVDLELIWKVIKEKLPELKKEILKMKDDLSKELH